MRKVELIPLSKLLSSNNEAQVIQNKKGILVTLKE